MADSQELEQDQTIDVDAMSDRIGASLFGDTDKSEPGEPIPDTPAESPDPSQPIDPTPPAASPPQAHEVPQSWRKDMREHWPKLDPKVQGYYIEREKQMLDGLEQYKKHAEYAKPFLDTLQPYSHLFTQRSPQEMVGSLLRAHQLLTNGSLEDRRKAYQDLGHNLKLIQEQQDQAAQAQDPALNQITQKLSTLEQVIQAQQEEVMRRVHKEKTDEVNKFAADTTAHPYFDDVAETMMPYIQQGLSLPEAYEAAVWANPAVRTKEQARLLTEHDAKLKEKARLDALPKKKAAGVNVRGSDTGRTPTEPVGSIDDTIKGALRNIRQRAS